MRPDTGVSGRPGTRLVLVRLPADIIIQGTAHALDECLVDLSAHGHLLCGGGDVPPLKLTIWTCIVFLFPDGLQLAYASGAFSSTVGTYSTS